LRLRSQFAALARNRLRGPRMDLSYTPIKHLHLAAVTVTFAFFAVRVGWMIAAPERLQRRWVKIVPHAIDTVLLFSGAYLAWRLGGAGVRGWLPAKLAALVVYVALGIVALRRGRTRQVRIAAALGAVLAFAYIVSVAVTRSPVGFLRG
jgi:uncharacterized membrane protein SirB2